MSARMGLFQRPLPLREFYVSLWMALLKIDDDSEDEEDRQPLANVQSEVEKGVSAADSEREAVESESTEIAKEDLPQVQYQPWSEDVERFLPRFAEILQLEHEEEGWVTKVSKPTATIAVKLVTTMQAPSPRGELPIVRAAFDFELDLTPDDLYAVLYDVELRKQWDSDSVLEYEEFEHPYSDSVLYYMVNKAPWPFSSRDFVERRLIRRTSEGDIEIVFFNIEHEVRLGRSTPSTPNTSELRVFSEASSCVDVPQTPGTP